MWTLASAWTSGLLGTLVDMARVARSDVAPDMGVAPDATVPADTRDESSRSVASAALAASTAGRRRRPPRPRDGEVDDSSRDGQAENVHDQLIDAAHESAALEESALEESAAAAAAGGDVGSEFVGSALAAVRTERTPLTDRERAMLEFERFWWRHAGSKEQAIRETFDLSATHYYRLLNALLDQPAAVEFDPLVVGRLRRLRASRARRRAGR